MNRIKLLIMTSRPISWVNTAFPFAAGYLMLGGGVDARLIVGTLFFLIPYNLLMYGVNDAYDYESDIRNPRKGGIEGAVTAKKYHALILRTAFLSSAPFVAYMLTTGTITSMYVLIGVLFFVVAYSVRGLRFKEKPLLDSITSSIHFVGPLVYAYSLVGATNDAWIVAVAFFLWGMASHAFGAVQDVIPDREGGLSSVATVFGARNTVIISTVAYSAAVLLVASLGNATVYVVAISGLAYVINSARFVTITDATSGLARAGWRRFLLLNYVVGAVVTMACLYTALY